MMILQPPPRFNLFSASLQHKYEPLVLTLNVVSQSSTVVLPKLGYLGSRTPSTIYKDLYL